ncbi:50S ribosomal protein L9 [Kordiimonas pumila]|uniref:Large ribosomal subunit protein bL9 n=1 Tax=Kordiimonas pumila TaxID=2161677 RepID=A0ABV7D1C4_9PROT|nr:50S ribosomal protein L9 [Kordiimonas pumila]
MEVILLERVEKLGQMGAVVKVKDGFARNYLLPQKKALRATASNKAAFEAQRAYLETENLKRKDEASAVAAQMTDIKVIMVRAAGESGQLYGSVTSRDIADAVTEAGVKIARSLVVMDRAIKTIGLHDVVIRLHPEVAQTVVVNIARSVDEAETQFKTGSAVVADDRFESDFESTFDQDDDLEDEVLDASEAEASEEEKSEE